MSKTKQDVDFLEQILLYLYKALTDKNYIKRANYKWIVRQLLLKRGFK